VRINQDIVDLKRVAERAKATNRIWKDASGTERVLDFPRPGAAMETKYFDEPDEKNWREMESRHGVDAINILLAFPNSKYWAMSENPLDEVKLGDWIKEEFKKLKIGVPAIAYTYVNGNPHTDIMWIRYVYPDVDEIEVYLVNEAKNKLVERIRSKGAIDAVMGSFERESFADNLMRDTLNIKDNQQWAEFNKKTLKI